MNEESLFTIPGLDKEELQAKWGQFQMMRTAGKSPHEIIQTLKKDMSNSCQEAFLLLGLNSVSDKLFNFLLDK